MEFSIPFGTGISIDRGIDSLARAASIHHGIDSLARAASIHCGIDSTVDTNSDSEWNRSILAALAKESIPRSILAALVAKESIPRSILIPVPNGIDSTVAFLVYRL